MRILAISDVHADATTNGVRRFDEVQRHVHDALSAAIEQKVDVFVFAGDLCDPESGPVVVKCVELMATVAVRLEHAGIQSIFVAGNHDVIDNGEGWTTLDPLMALTGHSFVHLATRCQVPGFSIVGVEFACLPFTSVSTAYDAKLAASDMHMGSGPLVVISHLNVRGVVPGEESMEMPRGREIWLPDEELAAVAKVRPTLILQGHYHRRQTHRTPSGLDVHVIGSAAIFSHGEERHEPGYLIVEVST